MGALSRGRDPHHHSARPAEVAARRQGLVGRCFLQRQSGQSEERFGEQPQFDAGELGTHAVVDAGAEREMAIPRTIDPERVRVVELVGIAVGAGEEPRYSGLALDAG
jgi:hypothetical protein